MEPEIRWDEASKTWLDKNDGPEEDIEEDLEAQGCADCVV